VGRGERPRGGGEALNGAVGFEHGIKKDGYSQPCTRRQHSQEGVSFHPESSCMP
jgi:hypothetical protein